LNHPHSGLEESMQQSNINGGVKLPSIHTPERCAASTSDA
jgi:hypothetical protein